MLRVLIIDDNLIRVEKIHSLLNDSGVSNEFIDTFHSSIPARNRLRTKKYDILILDVCLPKREGDRPSKDEGLSLLKDLIDKNKYIIPEEIIGITEYDDIFRGVVKSFRDRMIYVLKYSENSNVWKDRLVTKIKSKLVSSVTSNKIRHAVLTVHGIRTYGKWQTLLEETITEQGIAADVIHYKYSYLPFISYTSFFVRWLYVKRFKKHLLELLKTNKYEIIDIVGHSFGTYLIAQSLINISIGSGTSIRNVIFSGSVVNENFDWSRIVGSTVKKVINDCAYDDFVLLINKCFVPFGGMSGRVGFTGFESSVINRYFKGGHDAYYMKNKKIDNTFIKKYWIPILTIPDSMVKYDCRGNPKFYEDIMVLVHLMSLAKNAICIFVPIYLIIFIALIVMN